MKKYIVIVVLLLIGVGINVFKGNPLSYMVVKQQANKYVVKGYNLKNINYNMKDCYYYAHLQVEGSKDQYFQVVMDYKGKEIYNTLDEITNKSNTAARLNKEYREYIDELINSSSILSTCSIAFGELDIGYKNQELAPYFIPQESLVIDKEYKIDKLGKQAGHIILYFNDCPLTDEYCNQLLNDIKDNFDKANKSFKSIDITLNNADDTYALRYFPYDDIGNIEKVRQVRQDTIEYYIDQDKLKLS